MVALARHSGTGVDVCRLKADWHWVSGSRAGDSGSSIAGSIVGNSESAQVALP